MHLSVAIFYSGTCNSFNCLGHLKMFMMMMMMMMNLAFMYETAHLKKIPVNK